jgi:hypothetical protein
MSISVLIAGLITGLLLGVFGSGGSMAAENGTGDSRRALRTG